MRPIPAHALPRLALGFLAIVACAGCSTRGWATYDGQKLLEQEFSDVPLANVTPVHCEAVLSDGRYPSSLQQQLSTGIPPYRLEVLAPAEWVVLVSKAHSLTHVTGQMKARGDLAPGSRGYWPDWFVQDSPDRYDIYAMLVTSYPYQVMYIDTVPASDGRRRIFLTCK